MVVPEFSQSRTSAGSARPLPAARLPPTELPPLLFAEPPLARPPLAVEPPFCAVLDPGCDVPQPAMQQEAKSSAQQVLVVFIGLPLSGEVRVAAYRMWFQLLAAATRSEGRLLTN